MKDTRGIIARAIQGAHLNHPHPEPGVTVGQQAFSNADAGIQADAVLAALAENRFEIVSTDELQELRRRPAVKA